MTQFNFCPKCGTKCIHPRTNNAVFGAMLDTACPNPHCAWAYWTGAPISMGAQSIQYEQYLVPDENWESIIKQSLPDFNRESYKKPRDVAAIFSPEENQRKKEKYESITAKLEELKQMYQEKDMTEDAARIDEVIRSMKRLGVLYVKS